MCQRRLRSSRPAVFSRGSSSSTTETITTRSARCSSGSAAATARAASGVSFQAMTMVPSRVRGATGGVTSSGRPVSIRAASSTSIAISRPGCARPTTTRSANLPYSEIHCASLPVSTVNSADSPPAGGAAPPGMPACAQNPSTAWRARASVCFASASSLSTTACTAPPPPSPPVDMEITTSVTSTRTCRNSRCAANGRAASSAVSNTTGSVAAPVAGTRTYLYMKALLHRPA